MQLFYNANHQYYKKIMKNLFLLFVPILFSASCKKETTERSDRSFADLTLIAQGDLYGAGDEGINEQNTVIIDAAAWADLMAQMNSVNNVTEGFTETDIDFDNYMVFAVFDNVKRYSGYSIKIDDLVEGESEIRLNLARTNTGAIAPTVVTQPYYIVKYPKNDKSIVFE